MSSFSSSAGLIKGVRYGTLPRPYHGPSGPTRQAYKIATHVISADSLRLPRRQGPGSSHKMRMPGGDDVAARSGRLSATDATCPTCTDGSNVAIDDDEHACTDPTAAMIGQTVSAALSASERSALGRMCKRLLDTGRLRYLEAHGYAGRLQEYVEETVSPENTLIVGWACEVTP